MADNQQELLIKVAADTGKAIGEINRLRKEVDHLSKKNKALSSDADSIDRLSQKFGNLARQIGSIAAAYAGLVSAGNVVSLLSDVEQNLIDIAKTTGLTDQQLKLLDDGLANLSQTMSGIKYTSLQEIAAQAGQLGIKGTKNILTFSEAVAKVSVATEYSASAAATAFSNLANSLQAPVTETENLASAANELSANTSATVPDIVDIATRAGGMARQFGLSSAQTLGLSASLKNLGISSEIAGTSLQTLLGTILTRYEDVAGVIGISAEEMAQKLKTDPISALNEFLAVLSKMDKIDAAQTLKDLGLTGAGVSRAVLGLAGNIDELNLVVGISEQAFAQNSSIQSEYEKAADSNASATESLKNSVELLTKALSGPLLDALTEAENSTSSWLNALDKKKLEDFSEATSNYLSVVKDAALISIDINPLSIAEKALGLFIDKSEAAEQAYRLFAGSVRDDRAFQELGDAIVETYAAADEFKSKIGTLTSEGIEEARKEISALIAKNEELVAYWRNEDPKKYADVITKLSAEVRRLKRAQDEIITSKPFEGTSSSAEEAIGSVKKLTQEHQKLLDKEKESAQQRLNSADVTLSQLYAKEVDLKNKIVALENEKLQIRQKYANLRATSEADYENSVADARQKGMTEYQKYLDDQNRAARAISDARGAYDEKNYALAKKYLDDYDSLIKRSAGEEIKQKEKVSVSRSTTLGIYQSKYKAASDIRRGLIDQEEAKEIEASNAKIAAAQRELAINRLNIKAQLSIVDLLSKIVEKATGVELDIDTQPALDAIKEIDGQIDSLEQEKKKIPFDADIDPAKQKISQLSHSASKSQASMTVDADTSAADRKIEITHTNAKTGESYRVDADTTPADGAIQITHANAQTGQTYKVDADTTPADVSIEITHRKAAEAQRFGVDAETSGAALEIDALKNNISSVENETINIGANTSSADKEIGSVEKSIAKSSADITVGADTSSVSGDVDAAVSSIGSKEASVPVNANIEGAIGRYNEMVTQIRDTMISAPMDLNDSAAVNKERAFRAAASQTIFTTQVITQVVQQAAAGGGLIERYAKGGFVNHPVEGVIKHYAIGGNVHRGPGRVPGYDPTDSDKVPAMLTAGEYVIKRNTVKKLGVGFLDMLNRMQINIPKLASGGVVPAVSPSIPSPTSTSSTPNFGTVNLNIGAQSFEMLADEKIAEGLMRYINEKGGM